MKRVILFLISIVHYVAQLCCEVVGVWLFLLPLHRQVHCVLLVVPLNFI